jgi:hypothetical protein
MGDTRAEPMAATVKVFAGGILMRNAAGFVTKGATATGAVGIRIAVETVDNTSAAGAAIVRCRSGIFSFASSAAGDAIAQADEGKVCFVVDDQTVAKTNGGATRSPLASWTGHGHCRGPGASGSASTKP